MGEINIDYLKRGVVLADDIKDSYGRFLISRGTRIEEKHIRIMKMWGITSANVEGLEQEHVIEEKLLRINPELLQKIKAYVDALFNSQDQSTPNEDHEALKEIKYLCILRTAQQIESGALKLSDLDKNRSNNFLAQEFKKLPQEKIIPARELVDKNVRLYSFPDIYYRVAKIINDTGSSAQLAEAISNDPGLCAAILKTVNSAFYGLPAKIVSIVRAIALIGNNELNALVMGISAIRYFKNIPARIVDMKKFWLHSAAVGVFARLLAHYKAKLPEEELYIAGLLHDIGRLILFKNFPKTTSYAMQLSLKKKLPLSLVEKDLFGYDHAELSGLLLEKWNFPSSLQQMIKNHHTPHIHHTPHTPNTPSECQKPVETAIIFLADILASTMGFGSSGNCLISPFDKETWNILNLSTGVLMTSIQQADRQVAEMLQIFSLDQDKDINMDK